MRSDIEEPQGRPGRAEVAIALVCVSNVIQNFGRRVEAEKINFRRFCKRRARLFSVASKVNALLEDDPEACRRGRAASDCPLTCSLNTVLQRMRLIES